MKYKKGDLKKVIVDKKQTPFLIMFNSSEDEPVEVFVNKED